VLLLVALVLLLVFWALRSTGGGQDDTAGHDDGAGGPAASITPGPTPSESLIDERPGGREDPPSGEGSGDEPGEGSGEGSGDASGGSGETEEAGGTGEAGDPGGGEERNAGGGAAGQGGIADPAALPECGPDAVTVSLRSDANEYPPGVTPDLRLTVQNTSDSSCHVDFGHAALTVTVADRADERVWSSADCPEGASSAPEGVPAGGTAVHTVTWDRRHSAADCGSGGGAEAAPGTYLAEAELTGHPVVRAPFTLDED
jgi:hypothetical protein